MTSVSKRYIPARSFKMTVLDYFVNGALQFIKPLPFSDYIHKSFPFIALFQRLQVFHIDYRGYRTVSFCNNDSAVRIDASTDDLRKSFFCFYNGYSFIFHNVLLCPLGHYCLLKVYSF